MDEKPLSKRSLARDCLFKALYATQISDENLNDSLVDTLGEHHEKAIDQAYAKDLARDYSQEKEAVHALLEPFIILQGKANITDIELAILRLAATEFLYKPDTPVKVVINEAILLSKRYGSEDGYKFVNGVLDKAQKKLHGH